MRTCCPPGDRSGGGAEGERGAEGGGGCDPPVSARPPAALPADPQLHLGRAQLHHHLPHAHQSAQPRFLVMQSLF